MIETKNGVTIITGGHTLAVSWLALRQALILEARTGLKLSRRRSVKQIAKQRLGIPSHKRVKFEYLLYLVGQEMKKAFEAASAADMAAVKK